jgi:hypothetical protein
MRVWINSALDLSDALLMVEDHLRHTYHATDHTRGDRYKEDSQAENSIDESVHSCLRVRLTSHRPSTDFLVELTGIEPVASWLQTRRSPS